MNNNYFHRVSRLTPTKFWINNVTREEAYLSIKEGAVGCTQNPSYTWKMIQNPEMKQKVNGLIDKYSELPTNEIVVLVQRDLVADIAEIFKDLYINSNKKYGYVSVQGDPFHEDAETIVKYGLLNHEMNENIMVKIPVTVDGLKAIEVLAAKGVPINATEVMTVRQALDVCEVYARATKNLKNKAPIYFSHITGILDEYLTNKVKEEGIAVEPDYLWQAGIAAAKKTYWVCKQANPEVGFIGGGARGLQHFTEMVGADASITINWVNTADRLLEENPPVVERFRLETPHRVVDELLEKIPDYRKCYFINAIEPEEYEEFGPVVLFRKSFESAWTQATEYIDTYLNRK